MTEFRPRLKVFVFLLLYTDLFQFLENKQKKMSLNVSVSFFLQVMVGLDTGCVALIDVAQSDVSMTASTTEHDGVVATLATCGDRSRAATGSYDRWSVLNFYIKAFLSSLFPHF